MARTYSVGFENWWNLHWSEWPEDGKQLAWAVWIAGRELLYEEMSHTLLQRKAS